MSKDDATDEAKQKGVLDQLLSLFAEVHAGEGLTAIVLTLDVCLLLVAYYVLKTVREPLIIVGGGAEAKSYATAGQAVLLFLIVPAYAALTRRYPRLKLITITSIFFASNLLLFYVLAQLKVPYLGVVFYLWLGCFSLMVIAQFWSFANDIYTPAQGKRLFAIVGIGSSVGAVAGSFLAGLLVKPLGPYQMMLVAAALLLVCLGLTRFANNREGGPQQQSKKPDADKPVGGKTGFVMIMEDRYLLLIALVILVLNLVNTTGEYILDKNIIHAASEKIPSYASLDKAAQEDALGKFVGVFRADFFFWVNLIGALVQMFLVSRIFKYLGVRAAMFSLPLIAFGAYGIMAFYPALALVRIAKIAENSCDYSLYNTVKQALWLPTSREAKYNAKAAIDTFIVRIGDLLSGGIVLVGSLLAFGTLHFAILNMGLVGVWLFLVVLLRREHIKKSGEDESGAATTKSA
jgi:AAA family ATP:ADP antiporter